MVELIQLPIAVPKELHLNPWLTLEGGQKIKFQQLSGDFPLNHNKQKCTMAPNNNHESVLDRESVEPHKLSMANRVQHA